MVFLLNEAFLPSFSRSLEKQTHPESTSAALTLPARFADGLDVNVHRHVLLGSLLTTVERRHRDPVALLLLVAQPLRVSDVSWGKRKNNDSAT